jgi:hypothetical protein
VIEQDFKTGNVYSEILLTAGCWLLAVGCWLLAVGSWIQSMMNIRSPSSFWTQGLGDIQDVTGEIGVRVCSASSIANIAY